MRKRVFGRQFNRDTNERKALFKSLMSSLVLQERIRTTEEKAKAIRSKLEKLVTKAKKKGRQAEMFISPYLSSDAVKKMIIDIAPRFAERPGGYTRIIKIGNRFSDSARMAVIEWVEKNTALQPTDQSSELKPRKNIQKSSEETEIQDAEIVTEKPKKEKKTTKKQDSKVSKKKKEKVEKNITKKRKNK